MKAAVGGDAVDTATRAQHWMPLRPSIVIWIDHFDSVRALAAKAAFETAADNVNFSADGVGREMISLGRQIWQFAPAIGLGIVDREIRAARRTPAGHINFPVHHGSRATAAFSRHGCARRPLVSRGIVFINRIDESRLVWLARFGGLPADG